MLKFYETFQKYNVPENLKDEVYDLHGTTLKTINNFSKINILVGPNNSGKSKFIRELIKQKPVPYYGDSNWEIIVQLVENVFFQVNEKLKEVYSSSNFFVISNSSSGEIINNEEMLAAKKRLTEYSADYKLSETIRYLEFHFVTLLDSLKGNDAFYIREKNSMTNHAPNDSHKFLKQLHEIIEIVSPLIDELKKFQFSSLTEAEIPRIYIPSVRSLRSFASKADIKQQTRNEYGFNEETIIYSGQDFPAEVFDLTNTNFVTHQKLIQFQELLSKEFFNSKNIKLTYNKKDGVLLIKIGEEIEKPIHELGDGLQMIIILTFPFFTNDSGLIAIEEPELFIHPGLQKTFIKFLISNPKTENFQIFLATHSNHILDSINYSDLISLFSIEKKEKKSNHSIEKIPDFIIENLAFGNENFLNRLGITNTSVYLSNCTIWVEGITDKLYIQKFISEYLKNIDDNSKYSVCKEYKEGINYSFALTGGDSIIHWDFSDENEYHENTKNIIVKKFCSKSLVIVDNDFGKNTK